MTGKFGTRRAELTGQIADALLDQGVALIPLRDMAGMLGTSDRMLLYYFDTQAGLVTAVLSCLSERLSQRLDRALPDKPLPPALLLKKLMMVMAQPDIARTLRVWADVSARGARGEAPFEAFSRATVSRWTDWIEKRLEMKDRALRRKTATAMLVVVEGVRMIELAAPGTTKGAAFLLGEAFVR